MSQVGLVGDDENTDGGESDARYSLLKPVFFEARNFDDVIRILKTINVKCSDDNCDDGTKDDEAECDVSEKIFVDQKEEKFFFFVLLKKNLNLNKVVILI